MEDKELLSKIIDKIFAMKKETALLILILTLGFVLRLISAINLGVYADDALHGLRPINFIGAGKLETYDQSSGLWYAFNSVIYSLFGITTLTSRLPSLIFGSLSILLIFFLALEFFDKRIALFSAFLLAISPYLIRNTIAEMDSMAMFFVLFSMLFFVRAIRQEKKAPYVVSGVLLGLAIYTKVYPLLFIPSMLIYFFYFNKKQNERLITKPNIKKIALFLAVIFIFTVPVLTHNYLLYQEKGFLDLQFTKALGLGKNTSAQYYAWDAQFDLKNSWAGLFFGDTKHIASGKPLLLGAMDYVRVGDPIAFYLGILGIFLILFYKKEYQMYMIFFILSILFILPFLASAILLPKHYLFLAIFLMPISALALSEISKKLQAIKDRLFTGLLLAIIIFALVWLTLPAAGQSPALLGKSHVTQVINFKESGIPEGSLIIADSRIYSGRIKWLFHGKPYVDGIEFLQFLSTQDKLEGKIIAVDTFYFECVKDDCGWGREKITGEFNQSMEQLTNFISENGELLRDFSEPYDLKGFSVQRDNIIRVYHLRLNLKEQIFTIASQPRVMHINTVGYTPAEAQFDYFEPSTLSQSLLYRIAKWIVLLSVALSFIGICYVLYLFSKV